MKGTWSGVVGVSAVLLVAQVPVRAHHSFAAEFDAKKSVTLTGTVASIKWTNPHAHVAVDVKDQNGQVISWDFEMGSPNALMRRGWSRSSLKPGDTITVNGYLAKDGTHLANARSITLGDGRNVFAGSSIETGQTP
jgi:Family of unknown function (DUF6152)